MIYHEVKYDIPPDVHGSVSPKFNDLSQLVDFLKRNLEGSKHDPYELAVEVVGGNIVDPIAREAFYARFLPQPEVA